MKLKDITILRNAGTMWGVEENPTPQTKYFLLLLFNDPYFQKRLIDLRTKYKIPTEGYSVHELIESLKPYYIEDPLWGSTYSIPDKDLERYPNLKLFINKDETANDIKVIADHYKLAESFIWRLFYLIAFNAFINYSNYFSPDFIFGENNIKESIEDSETPIGAILLKNKLSKSEFIEWINKNWEYIDKGVVKKLHNVPNMGKRSINIELIEEMYYLFKENKTIMEITEIMANKYPNDDRISEQWVRLNIERFVKKLNIFINKHIPQ